MDLNKLRTFTVVAEIGSITKAAEALYRTQPAISNQLKDLEQELDLKLFDRKNARIFLTKEGQTLYQSAKEQIAVIEDTAIRLKNNKTMVNGMIKIAVEQDSISYLLPKIIAEFRQEFPLVQFEIVTLNYDRIEEALINNEVDFGLLVYFYQREFFNSHPIYKFSRSLVGSPDYVSQFSPVNSVEDLLQFDTVSYLSPFGDMRFWLKKNGFSSQISTFEKKTARTIVHDAYTLNEMLFSGLGIGFSFDNLARNRSFDDGLTTLLPSAEPMYVTVDFAYRKVRNESYLNQCFKEFVLDNVENWT